MVAFGAFFGLAAANVVGVTAHTGSAGGTIQASAAPTLAPGDFFGLPGGTVAGTTSGAGQAAPQLQLGGSAPMLSSGGS